jgi:mono/diheme cytochrome c family protein/uncharacterized membrane protein
MKKRLLYIKGYKRTILTMGIVVLVCIVLPLLIDAQSAPTSKAGADNTHFWLWNFLGHLHPLLVHFPVSLLVLAAAIELFSFRNFNGALRPAIRLLLYAGAASAILSVICGLLLNSTETYGSESLQLHQWTGIAVAVLAPVAAYLHYLIVQKNKTSLINVFRSILFLTTTGVAVASHLGANITHGDQYLSAVLPWSDAYKNKAKTKTTLIALRDQGPAVFTPNQQLEIYTQVKTIFAHNCYSCHGAEKIKGDLRLDAKKFAFRGGKSGKDIITGDPHNSEIIRRLNLPAEHKEAMPSKGKRLTEDEIALVSLWIEKGAVWPDVADKSIAFRVAKMEPRMPPLPPAGKGLSNPVDLWVNNYFEQKNIDWPQAVDDRIYLRRIYLDIIGMLPSPEQLESFTRDSRPDKRGIYVRELLNRNDDYATHWLSFWNDALRNDYTGTGYITGGRFNITGWLYNALQSNKPYNQFVKELISPNDSSKGFISGIKWRGVVNSSQSTEMQAAQNVAQVFLGLNLKCASCHNSFISDWKLEDAYAFANIFSDTTLIINRCDIPTGKKAGTRMLWKELGTIDSSAKTPVKLQQLANNLVQPADGRLYRTLVNRIWAQLMGRGIVAPADMMDNEPWSQDLLDWLASNFANGQYDIKELIYLITTSQTYMLPSVPIPQESQIVSKDFVFKGMLRRRLDAEQFADIVSGLIAPLFPDSVMVYNPYKTANTQKPNPFFARASLVPNNSFLTALGRPNRETVSTSRESRANLLQALALTNGNRFVKVLQAGSDCWKEQYKDNATLVKQIYLRALNRTPTEKEFATAKKALDQAAGTAGIEDLLWSIVLLPEFQIVY